MALNDDYYDIKRALEAKRKGRAGLVEALQRIMSRLGELEDENDQLKKAAKLRQGAE